MWLACLLGAYREVGVGGWDACAGNMADADFGVCQIFLGALGRRPMGWRGVFNVEKQYIKQCVWARMGCVGGLEFV
jgi:hypothetical protein